MKKIVTGLCLAAASWMAIAPLPALAEHGEHGYSGRYGRHTEHQWRAGRWHHGSYGGRIGWWWIVDGIWYPYAQRSDSYPVYQETVVVQQPAPPPTVIVQQPVQPQYPPQQTQQYPAGVTPQPNSNLWYYCDASRTYYPYTNSCASGWRAVPATPPTGVIR